MAFRFGQWGLPPAAPRWRRVSGVAFRFGCGVGFASGGSSPEGQVSGMASVLGVGLGWVVLAAIPSTSLRVITPAQGGPLLVVFPLWAFGCRGGWVWVWGPLGPV